MTQAKIYSTPDLSKNWFVWYKDQGKRVRVYGNINKEKTAEARMEAAEALLIEIIGKIEDLPQPKSLEDQAMDFIELQNWRQKSRQTYITVVRRFVLHAKGKELTPAMAQEFFQEVKRTKNPTTYNKYLQKLKLVLNGVGKGPILEGIEAVRENRQPARYFQRHQMKKLSAAISCKDPELFLFVKFVYYCFIRPKELRQLKADNLLLDSNQIFIPGEVSKNKKSEYVAIPEAFRADLDQFRAWPPGQVLFPVAENNMYNRHKRILKALGFGKGYCLYSWKHTGAIQAVKNGVGVKELQIQLRHHSLDQVNEYLRQMGVWDLKNLQANFPAI
jgi:integrase